MLAAQETVIKGFKVENQENKLDINEKVRQSDFQYEIKRLRQEIEDVRLAAKKEQRLMLSAWQTLQVNHHKYAMAPLLSSNTEKSAKSPVFRRQTGFLNETEISSWLSQQRKNIDNQAKRR